MQEIGSLAIVLSIVTIYTLGLIAGVVIGYCLGMSK